jgi:hypothetical protein
MQDTIDLVEKTSEQNNFFLKSIDPKYFTEGKRIIAKYDWINSPIDIPKEWDNNIDKIIEFSKVYLEKRETFLKSMLLYFK